MAQPQGSSGSKGRHAPIGRGARGSGARGRAAGIRPSRRRHARAPFAAFVDLCAGEERRRVRAVDLSPGGLGVAFAAAEELPVAVCAEFPLPGLRLPLALEAELAWVDAGRRRAGFRFRGGNEALRELLARFVEGEFPG